MPRIRKVCLNKCRTLQTKHKTTQLWFLPVGSGNIKERFDALITLLLNNEFNDIKKSYHFYVAIKDVEKKHKKTDNDNVTYMKNPKNIKKEIEEIENKIKSGELQDNLIILAGRRLQLGISLRNVDIVTLWNSTESSDAIFQIMFRSMTEVETNENECKKDEYCEEKKFGFMVDMNPQRALTNVNLFSSNITKNEGDIQKYRQITDLINIDEDVFQDRYETDRDKFVKDLFKKLYESWDVTIENVKKLIGKFSFDMTKLQRLKKSIEKINTEKSKKVIDKPDSEFESGKTKEKITSTPKSTTIPKEKEINLREKAIELISEYISLLNIFTLYLDEGSQCILTDGSKFNSKIHVIHDINVLKEKVEDKKDSFLKILNGRLHGDDTIPYPEDVIDEVLKSMNNPINNLVINKLIMEQKKHYYTIHEPDKLIDEINKSLTPNKLEKDKNGEVFTPIVLVEDMLNNLDKSYTRINGRSIFTEREFKWLDPAVGIGNFPVIIYLRLMKGLVQIPDEEERRKHILEKMLYMVEISDKSIFILNKIFCGDKYHLNIHNGSYLHADCKYDFKFDVVVGNPPYNQPKKSKFGSNGNPFWQHFVVKSYYITKEKGILLFIHPPGWKKPSDEVFNPNKLQILNGEYYNDKKGVKSLKQIRQGQVWELFKKNGSFSFIYTNDQMDKKNIIKFFPAVDYYVYQKGIKTHCNTKNILFGIVKEHNDVIINIDLNYLPNLITNETQYILQKITKKEGNKKIFKRGIDDRDIKFEGKIIDWVYGTNVKGFTYKQKGMIALNRDDTVNINKVILNFEGGIKAYNVKYVSKNDEIGVLDKTLYTRVESDKEGKYISSFFNSNIVKFIFLITQYAFGQRTLNEHLIASSITIPPYVVDYYKFFGIEKYKKYIEDILSEYNKTPIIYEPSNEPLNIPSNESSNESSNEPLNGTSQVKKNLSKRKKNSNVKSLTKGNFVTKGKTPIKDRITIRRNKNTLRMQTIKEKSLTRKNSKN